MHKLNANNAISKGKFIVGNIINNNKPDNGDPFEHDLCLFVSSCRFKSNDKCNVMISLQKNNS